MVISGKGFFFTFFFLSPTLFYSNILRNVIHRDMPVNKRPNNVPDLSKTSGLKLHLLKLLNLFHLHMKICNYLLHPHGRGNPGEAPYKML